jgi:AraC family transcriptional regulator of adaptative response / DNA-3-methyladenine glycosylase II
MRYQPPYDWEATLQFLRQRAIPGVESIRDGSYARTIELDDLQGTVSVRPGEGHALRATIRFPKLSALPTIIARLRRVFDLAADPVAISAHLARDPALAPLIAARPGLRAPGASDGFELAARAVLGQWSASPAATRLAARVAAAHGAHLTEPDDELVATFPRPQALAIADLQALGLPAHKAAALNAVAAAFVADPDLLGASRGLDEAVQELQAIPGLGERMARYIALRELREPDAFPAVDPAIARALTDARGRRPSPREVLARAELWRPWRAYAAQHFWAAA